MFPGGAQVHVPVVANLKTVSVPIDVEVGEHAAGAA
jgi:hypothetical protein